MNGKENGSSNKFTLCLLDKFENMWYNKWVVTQKNHEKRQQEGILKIEQCTTSEQALESDSAKAKSDFETVKARQKQKML